MGHWDDTRIAIESRLADNWTTTPIRYWSSGVPFAPTNTAYVALQIEEFEARQISLGPPPQLHRYFGVITLQVLLPEGQPAKQADGYCDTLDTLFRGVQFQHGNSGWIVTRTPQKRNVGIQSGWFQTNLVIPYKRDRLH